ncbi:MAG: hypothetical protein V4538_02380 [Bacteroidota bacterium]
MCGCNSNTREFIGVRRETLVVTKNDKIPLKHVLRINAVLLTPTPVVIGDTDKLKDSDEDCCISSGCDLPFLDDQFLPVTFDEQTSDTTMMLRIVKTLIVPNPNYLECKCNCNGTN